MSCDMSSLFFATRGREVISYIFFLFTLSFVVKNIKHVCILPHLQQFLYFCRQL